MIRKGRSKGNKESRNATKKRNKYGRIVKPDKLDAY